MQGTELFCTNSSAVYSVGATGRTPHPRCSPGGSLGVTLAEQGVLLPDPMAVTGPSHPFPRPRHGHIHERPLVGQHYLGLHPGPLRLVGAPSLGPAGAGTRAAPAPGQGWAPGGWASPWPQLWGSPGAEIHRLELVRRDHKHHVGMVGRSEVFLKI